MEYKATIGLEIHAELNTRTKMFCNSKNDPDEKRPNVNICPVCMAHPGTLPVINKEAVKHVIKVGLAIGGNIADFTEFDRKNYFYPDIPKGYQLSQYQYPIVSGGSLNGIQITRVHLEEDTAKSNHEKGDYTLVDFNRAGVPLMELVTEPVVKNATEAGAFARELQLLLRYLGAGEANMDKGEMRVEANISVSKTDKFGTKVEVKNINSFRAVEKAIDYEIKRQIEVIEDGGAVKQETRGWDENKQSTFSQREKESSHDYRYFPDPDLPKLKLREIPEFDLEKLRQEMPELPWQKRDKYITQFGIKPEQAEMFVQNDTFAEFFNSLVLGKENLSPEVILGYVNFITSDLVGLLKDTASKVPSVEHFDELMVLWGRKEITTRTTKDVLAIMVRDDRDPTSLMKDNNLTVSASGADLDSVVKKIIEANEKVVADYRAGKEAALQFLVGQCMKETRGSADPASLRETIVRIITL
jgi:aspartyl-tRNA(Asn)/glutamyl-tRNA(Gln) amidotransferase subunit B